MRTDCRVFAVREEEIEELRANPALVLGRGLFAGFAMRDWQDAGAAIELILSGRRDKANDPANLLLSGGAELDVPLHAGMPPRLLACRDVQALHAALKALDEVELRRRFNRQSLISTVLERISAETVGCSADSDFEDWNEGRFPTSEEDFVDDWTLDQAEEFERIAQQVEDLRMFVAQAVRRRQALVIVLRETE